MSSESTNNTSSPPAIKKSKNADGGNTSTDSLQNPLLGPQPNVLNSDSPRNSPRITKDNLYMILALWMEDFLDKIPESGEEKTQTLEKVPKESKRNVVTKKGENTPEIFRKENYRNVGAVLVLPNDVVWAADCSRDGVHAVERLLMKHYDKAEDCKMFMSRKPCPLCAKLLVQAKVKRVLYLPLEPEFHRDGEEAKENKKKNNEVDNLFTASAIAQTRFALHDEKRVVEKMKQEELKDAQQVEVDRLIAHFKEKFRFKEDWLGSIETDLPWPGFNRNVKNELQKNFEDAIYWMARVQVLSGGGLNENFKRFPASERKDGEEKPDPEEKPIHEDAMDWMARIQVLSGSGSSYKFILLEDPKQKDGFNPVENPIYKEQARHFMTMARFLAGRTDDPTTGVGAVIVSPNMKIVAFGWNGYPLKALFGEFARGGKTEANNKYPYVIHAEQTALLMRNTKNIEGSILFVTKTPCNECAPLIAMEGVKTVVLGDRVKLPNDNPEPNGLRYDLFPEMVKKGTFTCYRKSDEAAKSSQQRTINSEQMACILR